MARPTQTTILLLAVFVVASAVLISSAAAVTMKSMATSDLGWISPTKAMRRGSCRGTVGECLDGEDAELELGVSEAATRRVLASTGYIGYDALQRDNVPCSQRGASYYNCQPGAQANPYSRGCSTITQCRG